MRLVHNTFSYYEPSNRSEQTHYAPPLSGVDVVNARPFVVRVRGERYIPIQVIVWGRDAAHAEERVRDCIETCAAKRIAYDAWKEANGHTVYPTHIVSIRDKLAAGSMIVEVEEYDVSLITDCLPWAANGGIQ